jgi:hypothetical protein
MAPHHAITAQLTSNSGNGTGSNYEQSCCTTTDDSRDWTRQGKGGPTGVPVWVALQQRWLEGVAYGHSSAMLEEIVRSYFSSSSFRISSWKAAMSSSL